MVRFQTPETQDILSDSRSVQTQSGRGTGPTGKLRTRQVSTAPSRWRNQIDRTEATLGPEASGDTTTGIY